MNARPLRMIARLSLIIIMIAGLCDLCDAGVGGPWRVLPPPRVPGRVHVYGRAAPGTRIALSGEDEPGNRARGHNYRTTADQHGRFILRNVMPGTYSLVVGRKDTGWIAISVEIPPGKDVDLGQIDAPPRERKPPFGGPSAALRQRRC